MTESEWTDDYLNRFLAYAAEITNSSELPTIPDKKTILTNKNIAWGPNDAVRKFYIGTIRFSLDFPNNGEFILPYRCATHSETKYIKFKLKDNITWVWHIADVPREYDNFKFVVDD